jgi:poly-gamma-glutamate capsule biosynthesis protein CapA/YwtB (metallophosphatase superfamily)
MPEEEFRPVGYPRAVRVLRFCVPGAALVAVVFAAVLGGRQSTPAGASQALALDSIRTKHASSKAQRGPLGSGKRVTLAFAGDVHFESPIREELAANPRAMLLSIRPVLASADLAIVNLETAVTTRGEAAPKTYTFRAPPSAFAALRAGGVDAASMANNHGMDFGEVGLRDSIAAARKARFPVIGIGLNAEQAYRPYRATVRGQRIAVLAATQVIDDNLIARWTADPSAPGLASAKDVPRLLEAVRSARKTSDTVVVFLHWGVELASCPTSDQRTLARELVAAGADLVVGAHAHRLLGTGRMKRALVSYGLGNFVWYSSGTVTSQTGVLLVTATGRRIDNYRFVPARIVSGTPRPLSGSERRQALSSWRSLRGCTGLRP